MSDACKTLESIARLAESGDEAVLRKELESFRKTLSSGNEFAELEKEVKIWQDKLAVILQEPIGRKGMAKHARFWIQKLKDSS